MTHYEYRLLEVDSATWEELDKEINTLAREGFRFRDSLTKKSGQCALVLEREAQPEDFDAWSAAKLAMNRPKPGKPAAPEDRPFSPDEDEP